MLGGVGGGDCRGPIWEEGGGHRVGEMMGWDPTSVDPDPVPGLPEEVAGLTLGENFNFTVIRGTSGLGNQRRL